MNCVDDRLVWGAALALFVACERAPTDVEPAPVTRWESVRAAPEGARLEGPARVLAAPAASSVVTPPFRATVVRLRVREGDVVEAGAPLVDVLMPELLDAAGRLEAARTRVAAWTEREKQLKELRADGLAKSVEVSEATARVAEARADGQAARAVLLSAGLREGEAASLLQGTGALTLRAPQPGVVTRIATLPGESREPSAGPLVQLAGEGPVRVEARFPRPVSDGGWRFVTGDGVRASLTLVSRAPMADAHDGTWLAWFTPEDGLVAGTLGRVVSETAGEPSAFLAPATSVRRDEQGTWLKARRGPVRVTVVRCEGDDCLVRGALEAGDEVEVESRR